MVTLWSDDDHLRTSMPERLLVAAPVCVSAAPAAPDCVSRMNWSRVMQTPPRPCESIH